MNTNTFNTIALKALEQTDEKLAVQVISNPNLDGKELSGKLDDDCYQEYYVVLND
jgi:hypothetical protein